MNRAIIIGTLLGDASIPKLLGRRKSYSIRWSHSLKQEEYCLWKLNQSKLSMGMYYRSRKDLRTNKIYECLEVYSKQIDLIEFRNLFYINNVKKVSKQLLDSLEPLSIAVWFCDDGSLYYNGNNCHMTLGVDGFDDESKQNIITYFNEKWGIQFKYHQARIRTTSVVFAEKFEELFGKYFPDFMNYKLLSYAKRKYKER
jgi:hypothetical protein